jgi:hypothetical protein
MSEHLRARGALEWLSAGGYDEFAEPRGLRRCHRCPQKNGMSWGWQTDGPDGPHADVIETEGVNVQADVRGRETGRGCPVPGDLYTRKSPRL